MVAVVAILKLTGRVKIICLINLMTIRILTPIIMVIAMVIHMIILTLMTMIIHTTTIMTTVTKIDKKLLD